MNQNSVKTIGINDEPRKDSHLVYVNQADGLKGILNRDLDEWFDENVDPLDLVNYSDEKEFSDSVHFKFHKMSTRNLTIGSSDNFHW